MTRRVHLTAEVPESRELHVKLPEDFPAGPVDVEIVAPETERPIRTFGDLLRSEFFGMWKDREDIGDSVEFARRLRRDAWKRGS